MEMLITASVLLVLTIWLVSVVRNMRSRDRWAITEYNWDPRPKENPGWELTDAPSSSPENSPDEDAEAPDKQQH